MAVLEKPAVLTSAFGRFRGDPEFGDADLAMLREDAFARFADRGFPTTRDEEWRFTSVAPIAAASLEPVRAALVPGRAAVEPLFIGGAGACYLVIVNGRFSSALSSLDRLPPGVTVRTGHESVHAGSPTGGTFVDLNTAFFLDAIRIEVAPKAIVSAPIYVIVWTATDREPVMAAPRIAVVAGEASQVSVVEVYGAKGTVLTNAVTSITLGPASIVDHVKLQRQADESFHLATMAATLGRAATFRSHAVTLGAKIARNDIVAVLDGEGAECTLNGLYVAGGETLVDTHTTIDHARAHCPSHEVYKGILSGRAHAVFNGKIIVRPDAQKTDAKQTNKALLLTDDAQINTKPQLEIFADDVKCTHGAAIGQLDEDALFYLRARGVDALHARNMLIHAFAGDVLNGIRIDAVRASTMALVDRALGTGE